MQNGDSASAKDTGARALLRRCDFLRELGDDDIAVLAGLARSESYADGRDLVREGDSAAELFILEEGIAAVLKDASGEGRHEIARLNAGDSFGEMALLDPGARSATVRALTPVRVLVIPIDGIVALAKARPAFVHALLGLARRVAARLRVANATAVVSLDRALDEERKRTMLGRFTFLLIVTYSLYTWVLGTATQVKELLGRSELVTVPVIVATVAVQLWFMRSCGYPAAFFGVTLRNAGRDVLHAIALTLPLMAVAVLLKLWLIANVPTMQGQPVFQMLSAAPGSGTGAFNPWLTLAYVVFVPFQELIYRGGLQGSLEHFLTGPWRRWMAIVGSNVIFSAAHLYISPGLSVTAFCAGLFWGWLYSRQRGLAGVSVSHILLGFWAFEIVDLGILE